MNYFLAFIALSAGTFIFLLAHYDLSPRLFLYKVTKRFIDPPASLRPVLRDAPYRRKGNHSKNMHRPVLLNLETSDGSGQACHPDVVFIPQGFGARSWSYWMACTPYPYQDDKFENPEIFASHDGLNWTVPEGLQNPVVRTPPNPGDHNSDPEILWFEDELWLFYRTTLRSKDPRAIPDENKLYVVKSPDGVHWSTPLEILSERSRSELMSPAVIHDGMRFAMWTVEVRENDFQLLRRTSSNGLAWSNPAVGRVEGLELGRRLWHIDVLREQDRLSAILVSCIGPGGTHSRIHYAYSEDQGLTWFASPFLFEQVYEFESLHQYRATLRKTSENPKIYELWYSACSLANVFSIAYIKLLRIENRLLPFLPEAVENETLTSEKQASFTASLS